MLQLVQVELSHKPHSRVAVQFDMAAQKRLLAQSTSANHQRPGVKNGVDSARRILCNLILEFFQASKPSPQSK
jgi:hypothetical protein